jgi:hypothetical protein
MRFETPKPTKRPPARPIPDELAALENQQLKIRNDQGKQRFSNTADALHNQYASRSDRDGTMGVALVRIKDDTGFQSAGNFASVAAALHIDLAIKDDKNFGSVVYVPDIRLIGPVKAHGRTVKPRDIDCTPCSLRSKFMRVDDIHEPSPIESHSLDQKWLASEMAVRRLWCRLEGNLA